MLAIALKYFQEQKCDYVVLEVGMGGRYDSTNIIEKPLITAVTNVHYDHTHLLGNSLEEIATVKAGIIKKASHFFTTEKNENIRDIFRSVCEKEDAIFHQVEYLENSNYELVKAIINQLGIREEYLQKALSEFKLPCRFEQVQNNPKIILDGAHNISKITYSLKKLENISYKNLHIVFGAGKTKDALGMLDLIAQEENVKSITFTFSDSVRKKSFSLKEMKQFIEKKYPKILTFVNFNSHKAVEDLEKRIEKGYLILVIGSLYISGEIRKRWFSEEFIIKNRKSF
jgi:dihydrofolate synthase/folylpolyglutamate synthase